MPSTDRLSNIARARVSAVVLDEASGRERAATEVFNKVDADGDGTITKAEFAPFYEKLKSQAYHDAEVKQRAESKIFKLKGRSRALIGGLGAAALFLLISILLNFAMVAPSGGSARARSNLSTERGRRSLRRHQKAHQRRAGARAIPHTST